MNNCLPLLIFVLFLFVCLLLFSAAHLEMLLRNSTLALVNVNDHFVATKTKQKTTTYIYHIHIICNKSEVSNIGSDPFISTAITTTTCTVSCKENRHTEKKRQESDCVMQV